MYELGSATLYDLQNAESAYALAETNLFIAEQNYIISKKSFKRVVGKDPVKLEKVINFDEKLNFEDILIKISTNNYDLLILKNEINNKQLLLEKEKSTKKPSLDFSASAEYSDAGHIDNGSETTDGTISLTLTIPIFQQNIDNSNIRKYYSQLLQSELEYEDYLADLEIKGFNLYKNYLVSKSNVNTNLKRIESIKTSLEIIEEEYNIGTKTLADLIEAESDLLSVNVSFLDSKKDFILNYFQIRALEGSLLDLFKKYLPNFN